MNKASHGLGSYWAELDRHGSSRLGIRVKVTYLGERAEPLARPTYCIVHIHILQYLGTTKLSGVDNFN
jgi:hypothetical protein